MPDPEPRSFVGEDGQEYIDRDSIDFDPDDGHYSGTAIDGTTKVPGPHQFADDVTENHTEGAADDTVET